MNMRIADAGENYSSTEFARLREPNRTRMTAYNHTIREGRA